MTLTLFASSIQEVVAQGAVRSVTGEGVPVSWATSCVPLYLNAQGRTRLNVTEVERVVRSSMDTWSDPSCAEMSLVFEGTTNQSELGYHPELGLDNKSVVMFLSSMNGDLWPHDRNALALTTVTFCENDTPSCPAGTIVDADVEVNEVLYQFTTGDSSPLNDLENTLTHELGHLLGFEHSAQPASTMYAVAPAGEREKRDLSAVDINGLCDAYPASRCLACDLSTYDLTRETEYEERLSCTGDALQPASQPESGCAQASSSGADDLSWALIVLLTLLNARDLRRLLAVAVRGA